jgi:hypothetical protein
MHGCEHLGCVTFNFIDKKTYHNYQNKLGDIIHDPSLDQNIHSSYESTDPFFAIFISAPCIIYLSTLNRA